MKARTLLGKRAKVHLPVGIAGPRHRPVRSPDQAEGEISMELMNPCGVFDVQSAPLRPRVALGPDTTVGLFANDKKNADVLLRHVQQGLAASYGVKDFRWFLKEATQPAVFTREFIEGCDAVVGAVCD